MRRLLLLLLALALPLSACAPTQKPPIAPVPFFVVQEYSHDPHSFTEGLELVNSSTLVESSGLYGKSFLRTYKIESGEVLTEKKLSPQVFGEGVTQVGDKLVQLTWKEGLLYVRDAATLEQRTTVPLEGEGWGTCFDKTRNLLWVSNGSSTLQALDPESFKVLKKLEVRDEQGTPMKNLNELECVEGNLWANIWQSSQVVSISGESGRVVKRYDLASLVKRAEELKGSKLTDDEVLNGLAYDGERKLWYITGKNWPVLFLVSLG